MSLISVEEGKKKVKSIFKKYPSVTHDRVFSILDRDTTLTNKTDWLDVLTGIQERLAQAHLKYLPTDQKYGVWTDEFTAGLKELCDNWSIALRTDPPTIGQTVMLAILDGSRPSSKTNRVSGVGQPLPVRYYSQRDSATSHANRMCFSSSCAMLLNYAKPGILHGYNGDDQYLKRVFQYGDSTDASAQIRALKSYGLDAHFSTSLTWADIDKQIDSKRLVPIGILHQGHVSKPVGFGHWIIIIGRTVDGSGYFVHDPFGELDLINGQYISTDGKNLIYSKKNLTPRFLDASGHGWGVIWKG